MVVAAPSLVPTFTMPSLSLVAPVADWAIDVSEPTILVADDDEAVRDLVAFKLAAAGYTTITAEDGSMALDMVHRIEANLLMRNYSGFLGGDGKRGKRIKGRQY